MDFNLDADFDKLSSFKIDMSDLDISTPPRKAGKQKERPEEESPSGSHRKKKDNFSFSFDFNEFDNLNFEPTLKKGSETSNKSKNKEVSSSQSGSGRSGTNLAEDIAPMEDDISSKLPDTQAVNTFKIDTEGDSLKAVHTRNEDDCLISITKDSCPPIPANSGEEVAIERARASPEKTMSAVILEKEQDNQQPEKITPPELSGQSVADNRSTQDTASDLQEEVRVPANLNSIPSGERNASEKLIAGPDSTNGSSGDESLPSESMTNSLRKNADGSKFMGVNDVTITTDGTELTRDDSEFEHLSATNGSNKLLQRAMANGRYQDSTSKLDVAPLKSGTTNNDLVSEIEKGTGVIQSIYFKRSNESEYQLQQALLSRTKIISTDSQRISSAQVNPPDERGETDLKATQSGISLAGMSRSQPRKLRGEHVQTGNAEGVKGINSTRECPNDDSIESVSKVMGTSRTHDQDVSKDGLVLIRSEKNIEDCNALSSHLHPSSSNEQANKSTSKSSINLRLPVSSITSIKTMKNPFLEKIRISPNQAGRTTPELPSLKSLSTAGGKLEALNTSLLKGIKTMRNAEQGMDLQETIGSRMGNSAETKKQTPPMLTLKRKAFEDSNADKMTFTPLKRLSASPSESRNAREPSDRVVNKQVCNRENMANDNTRNTLQHCQKPTLDNPQEVSLTELETSSSIESNSNVEKAEAFSKELEYICNMLKKKHDEAKEILVRAIVINNNLLMLNHPMHQEKISFQLFLLVLFLPTCTAISNYFCKSFTIAYIRMVQKFAALLISK